MQDIILEVKEEKANTFKERQAKSFDDLNSTSEEWEICEIEGYKNYSRIP